MKEYLSEPDEGEAENIEKKEDIRAKVSNSVIRYIIMT